jgi:RHS repeat-associated protein
VPDAARPTFRDTKKESGRDKIVAGLEENLALRSETTKVFNAPDGGAHVAQIFNTPVHFQTPDGEWREIDSSVVPVEGGFENGANDVDVFLPERLSDGPVTTHLAGGSLEVTLAGAKDAKASAAEESVTYKGVDKHVDVRYELTPTGYKENVVIHSDRAPSAFVYEIRTTALSLALLDDGTIEVRQGEGAVGSFPRLFVEEATTEDGAPGEVSFDVTTELEDLGDGRYRLTAALDQEWFTDPERRFPLTLDPSFVKSQCGSPPGACPVGEGAPLLKDMYGRRWTGGATQKNSTAPYLLAGMDESSRTNAYMTFDIRQQVRHVGDLVYDAQFDINNYYSHSPTHPHYSWSTYVLKRITQDWDVSDTDLPPVDESTTWASHAPCADGTCPAGANDWWKFDVTRLLQYWIDKGIPTNHGWRIGPGDGWAVEERGFYSRESGYATQPYLYVAVNAMPSTRQFVADDPNWPYLDLADDAPKPDDVFSTTSPVLRIKDLTDTNRDPIVVRYQVSKSPTSWTGSQLVHDTGWIPEVHESSVPLYALASGSYYWRVQASDTCAGDKFIDKDPLDKAAKLCDDLSHDTTRPNAGAVERPTSQVRRFIVDRDLSRRGSDARWAMWAQRLGNGMAMRVDQGGGNLLLEYPVDSLVTSGPNLDVGLTYNSDAAADGVVAPGGGLAPGWELVAGPGSKPQQIPVRVDPLGPGTQAADVVYRSGRRDPFVSTDGKIFKTIGPMASTLRKNQDGGWALTTYSGGVFTFDAKGDLARARAVSANPEMTKAFEYSFSPSRRLEWVKDASGRQLRFEYAAAEGRLTRIVSWTGATWSFGYDATQRLTSITDATNDTVEFDYDGAGRLAGVRDGVEAAKADGLSTTVTYEARQRGPVVKTVTLPGSARPWEFSYDFGGDPNAQLAVAATIVDPRGVATPDPDDYKVITDYGVNGLPVMRRGPHVPPNPQWPVERWRWDENGNLLCHRDAAANALANVSCTRQDAASGVDALQTEYRYQKDAPYLMTQMTGPASDATSSDRLVTQYNYDEGFTGLQVQYFGNPDLNGIPRKSGTAPNVDAGWGFGGPGNLQNDQGQQLSDNFSVRYFGEFEAQHSSGEKAYLFKANADDRVRVAVGDKVVIDCWAAPCSATGSATLKAYERYPIVVEYADLTGDARVQLQQETSPGVFETIPRAWFRPNIDALTSSIVTGAATTFERRTYRYSGREHLRLPQSETVTGANTTAPRVTSFDYNDHGRVTVEADQDVNGRRVTRSFVDGCEKTTSQAVAGTATFNVTRICNGAGDVTTETRVVGGIILNGTASTVQATRVTTSSYDALGRQELLTYPDGGMDTFTYDDAGRLKTESVKVSSTHTRTNEYFYEPQGWLAKTVSTAPEPGGAAPTVSYGHDDVGNATRRTDELGHDWLYGYNALNLRTSKEDPLGNEWKWGYDAAGRNGTSQRPSLLADGTPSAIVTKAYDARGNLLSRQLSDLPATTFVYDRRDLLKRRTDPDGVYTEWTYDAEGHPVTETAPVSPIGSAITRKMTYNSRGLLETEEDFRGKVTRYTYDRSANLKTVTLPGPNLMRTTYNYNHAGELEQVLLPRTASATAVLTSFLYEYDYDSMGRVLEERNAKGEIQKHAYTLAGEERAGSDSRGIEFTYELDRLGRRIARRARVLATGEELSETYEYDLAGNLELASNAGASTTISYDPAGRVDLVTSGGDVTDYDYIGAQVETRTDAAGETAYSYSNATGRLTTVTTPFSGAPAAVTYSPAGRLKTRTDPNGIVHTREYDVAGRLKKQVSAKPAEPEVATFTQLYDANSRVLQRTSDVRDLLDDGAWTFEYDDAGRLKKAIDPQGSWSTYDYDLSGNRTKVVTRKETAGVVTLTTDETVYDVAGRPETTSTAVQVDQAPPAVTQTTYAHDPAGNLTKVDDGVAKWTYAYDPWNRMSSASKSLSPTEVPVGLTYGYDALDRTATKGVTLAAGGVVTTQETERSFYAGVTDELVETSLTRETDAATVSVATEYASVAGAAAAMRRKVETQASAGGVPTIEVSTSYIGSGPHGDVTFVTDPDADVVGTKTYDPWGVVRTESGEEPKFGFQGDATDEETGLVDMGARYYLPSLGRFTTKDTYAGELAAPLTQNRYIYGNDDPVSMVDPTGHAAKHGAGGCGDCDDSSPSSTGSGSAIGQVVMQVLVAKQQFSEGMRAQVRESLVSTVSSLWGLTWGCVSSWRAPHQCVGDQVLETGHAIWTDPGAVVASTVDGTFGGALEDVRSGNYAGAAGRMAGLLGEVVAGGLVGRAAAVSRVTRGASSAADAARLARQLQFDEAASIFTRSGGLQNEVIAASRPIVPGSKLGNLSVIKALTADGSSIVQWAKYRTPTFQSPSGPFQVHFYYNEVTGAMNYAWDYKSVFVRR